MSYHPSLKDCDVDEARRLHDGYVRGHPERLSRFLTLLEDEGFDTTALRGFESFRSLDPLWEWLMNRPDLPNHGPFDRYEAMAKGGPDWFPWMDGEVPPTGWPKWFDCWLPVEAMELLSGIGACVNELLLRQWDGHWRFIDEGTGIFDIYQSGLRVRELNLMTEKGLDRDYFFSVSEDFVVPQTQMRSPIWERYEDYVLMQGLWAPTTERPRAPLTVEADEVAGEFMIDIDDQYCDDDTDIVDRFVERLRQDRKVASAFRTHREQVDITMKRMRDEDRVNDFVLKHWNEVTK